MGHDDVFDQRVMGWVNQIRKLVRTGRRRQLISPISPFCCMSSD